MLEILRPDADGEAEQAKAGGDPEQEEQHPGGMVELERDEQQRGGERNESEDHRLGDGGADIGEHRLEARDRG